VHQLSEWRRLPGAVKVAKTAGAVAVLRRAPGPANDRWSGLQTEHSALLTASRRSTDAIQHLITACGADCRDRSAVAGDRFEGQEGSLQKAGDVGAGEYAK
jgi:hypothetical protein